MGANFHFLAGLGVTEIADAIVDASIKEGLPTATRAIAVIFDLVVLIGFALAGYYANKFFLAAFLVGIIFYALDGVIVLLIGDYFMAAFHVFALYSLIRGFLACRVWRTYMVANNSGPPPPPPSAFVQP